MITLANLFAAQKRAARANPGYDQWERWSFYDRTSRVFYNAKEADCSSLCGAIIHAAGFNINLADPFYTGTFEARAKAVGFEVLPFTGLANLRPGDFVLNRVWHVEFVLENGNFYSARIDERGGITGGKAGNQTGRESGEVRPYVYSKGWDVVVRLKTSGQAPAPAPTPKQRKGPSGQTATVTLRIQNILDKSGYDVGLLDGDYGPRVTAAVQAYQRAQNTYAKAGLLPDGDWGPKTEAWYNWVLALQRALPDWKGVANIPVDGDYRVKTAAAVMTLQARNILYRDGIAGPTTIAFMQKHGSKVNHRPN